jgi:hypothetical protein
VSQEGAAYYGLMSQRYGVEYDIVTGCVMGWELQSYMDGYHRGSAAGVVLRIMARRARLLGLDAPARSESVPPAQVRVTVEQVLEARRRAEEFREGYDARNGRTNPDRHEKT